MFLAAFTSACASYPQAPHTKTAWLLRFWGAVCPQWLQRWLVNAGGIATTATGAVAQAALSSRRRRKAENATEEIARFSPAFCRTLLPGASTVPRAERSMFFTKRSSTQTTSKSRTRAVVDFSMKSFLRSACLFRYFWRRVTVTLETSDGNSGDS